MVTRTLKLYECEITETIDDVKIVDFKPRCLGGKYPYMLVVVFEDGTECVYVKDDLF